MQVKDYSLLCVYNTEFPVLKAYFMKNGIPFETSQFNNILTMVIYSCTPLDHEGLLKYTYEKFGW